MAQGRVEKINNESVIDYLTEIYEIVCEQHEAIVDDDLERVKVLYLRHSNLVGLIKEMPDAELPSEDHWEISKLQDRILEKDRENEKLLTTKMKKILGSLRKIKTVKKYDNSPVRKNAARLIDIRK